MLVSTRVLILPCPRRCSRGYRRRGGERFVACDPSAELDSPFVRREGRGAAASRGLGRELLEVPFQRLACSGGLLPELLFGFGRELEGERHGRPRVRG